MNEILSAILAAGTKAAAVGTMTGTLLLSYAGAVNAITPHLREAVAYQESVVATAEAVESSAAPAARKEWEPKKKLALQRIAALEASVKALSDQASAILE